MNITVFVFSLFAIGLTAVLFDSKEVTDRVKIVFQRIRTFRK